MKAIGNSINTNRFIKAGLAITAGYALLFSANIYAIDHVVTLDISANRNVVGCATQAQSTIRQSYILVDAPDAASAKGVMLLFVGGGGKLDIEDGQSKITSTNFLFRARHLFAAQGYHVAVMDAASDFLTCNGGLKNRRTSRAFTLDMAAVINDLRQQFPALPLWLIGTSRGTTAAAQAAAYLGPMVNGLVLTSPMTNPITTSVFDAPLAQIALPTLITTHEKDACFVTPPTGMESVKNALTAATLVKTKEFDGGFPALSPDPCDATTPHGYLGIEATVVKKITDWILEVQSQ